MSYSQLCCPCSPNLFSICYLLACYSQLSHDSASIIHCVASKDRSQLYCTLKKKVIRKHTFETTNDRLMTSRSFGDKIILFIEATTNLFDV